ncbi:MAG: histone deacetylase [Pyrinomonadaceae bacterium]|nr:histone deacetylase [Pyrinomonadaceae bacterium]
MTNYQLFYSPDYYADIGDDHVFPIKKFELARDILINENTLSPWEVFSPELADRKDLQLVHSIDYISRLIKGDLSPAEIRVLGLPWSESLVRRTFLAVSGTINASRAALKNAVSSNLAGGTHHAFPDRGEGFCVLNDVAIAIRVLQRESLAKRFLIIDCDVHQGNGTAYIFKDDDDVFTFSMHGAKNYPLRKEASNLDIELGDGTRDGEFLDVLDQALDRIIQHHPDVIYYLGGADPFERDQLGRLELTKAGLRKRDELVLNLARAEGIPIVTVMSGGYAKDIRDTVDIHCNTIRSVKKIFYSQEKFAAAKSV